MNKEIRKASELINNLFENLNMDQINQSNSFIKSWKEIVGEKISAHTKVLDVDKGLIIIEADHPGWSQQVFFKKKEIIKQLSLNFPELLIKNLVIRIVSECRDPYIKQNEPIGSGLIRSEEIKIDTPENMDDELKLIFERLKKSISKGKPN